MTDEPADWGDAAEARILDAALAHAADFGWTARLIAAAARDAGFSVAEAELLLPNGGRDLAVLLSRKHDREGLERLAEVEPLSLKIRERIRVAVLARVDAAMADAAATRSWTGFLALPINIPLGLRLAWQSADALWRWAGDTATDENHYSKRVLLSEILVTTLAIRLSGGAEAAEDHLDRRIAGVMAFEKWKSGIKVGGVAVTVAGALGRLRYGSARV
jgi:ubiquinone biosynthesis protein COQ9